MNAEPEERAEADVRPIDSIALEALNSATTSGNQPGARFDFQATPPGATQARYLGLNTEPVDGEPIDEYCNAHRLDVPERLNLFKQVCNAVHLAHQHAIIHQDLKPGNILVTSDGVPKLVNFASETQLNVTPSDTPGGGVQANVALAGELTSASDYASPEQITGETITTASDIYALGVVLYVLLTGSRPYHLKTEEPDELSQAICEQAPLRPSQVTTAQGTMPGQIKQRLSADLDSIILTAMRKEPDRRYRSADDFANDLKRYLEGSPVSAHRGSLSYRCRKFVNRHIVAMVITGLLLSGLMATVVASAIGLMTARRARDRAEASSRLGRQAVNRFFSRVTEAKLLGQPGMHPLRNELLKDAQQFYEEFLSQNGGDQLPRTELALFHTHLARISSITGSATEAVGQYQQAVALWEELVSREPTQAEFRTELALALNELGTLTLRSKVSRLQLSSSSTAPWNWLKHKATRVTSSAESFSTSALLRRRRVSRRRLSRASSARC